MSECTDQALAAAAFAAWWQCMSEDDDPLLTEEPVTLALNAWLQGWQHNMLPLNQSPAPSKETHG